MIASERGSRPRLGAVVEGWQAFWFRREPAYTLGLIRIAFGALAAVWALSLLPDLYQFFGADGVASHQRLHGYRWSAFEFWTSDLALTIGWAVLLLSALALMIGWHSRIAAILVFVLILSFDRRNPWVFNSGDVLVRIEALFLAISPCGAALSLDQRRRAGSFWSAQTRPRWPIRLMQVQLSLIYLATVQVKMSGDAWPQGTAVSYAWRLEDMLLLPTPDWVTTNAVLMNLATWGTLALELSIGIFVWNRRLRPWVLAGGAVMHLTIMITLALGLFSQAMLVLYLAFLPAETVQRLPDTIKRVVDRRRGRRPASPEHERQTVVPERNGHTYPRQPKHLAAEPSARPATIVD